MLHNRRNEGMLAVCNRISLALESMIQESVYKNRSVGSNANGCCHVLLQSLIIIYDLHSASAKNV